MVVDSLPENEREADDAGAGGAPGDHLTSFRVIYVAIFLFLALYVLTVPAVQFAMSAYFRAAIQARTQVDPANGSVVVQIQDNVREMLRESPWIRFGGVRVRPFVFGADGRLVYPSIGRPDPGGDPLDPGAVQAEAARVLPVSRDLEVSVPLDSLLAVGILMVYAAVLLWTLFVYNRANVREGEERMRAATRARNEAAARAAHIESELGDVRRRLDSIDPAETEHAQEIRNLRQQRSVLQDKLAGLARREEELSAQAARVIDLDEERRTLEDMLEEALGDLSQRDREIATLRTRVTTAGNPAQPDARSGPRAREFDQLDRRLRTLYKNLEVDDRAVQDLIRLGDEAMKLKAEESLKRLSDESENTSVRRKVGGLPPGLPVFELGFAGKGRIYYTHGRTRRFRLLCVGAKNSQKTDLEYLSKVVRE